MPSVSRRYADHGRSAWSTQRSRSGSRETVRTGPWLQVYEDLSGRDPGSLAAVELEALAEAAWWLCKTDESIAAAPAGLRRVSGRQGRPGSG